MIQIDVKKVNEQHHVAECNLYTDKRCIKILMHKNDYENLVKDGFFIRDGKQLDSADVLNTTKVYELPQEEKQTQKVHRGIKM